MAGSWGPSKAFLRRRKKRASSRRWAVMSKRLQETEEPIITPVTTQLGNGDPITQTSPAQLEDPTVKNVKKWVPLLGVRVLLLAFGKICQIWRNSLSQSFAGFLKTFSVWRGYAKQIETLKNQMAEMQSEMGALHSALQGGTTGCHCNGTVAGSSVCPMFPPTLLPLGCGSSVDPLPALTPPPPPPLPPPSTTFLQPYIPKKRVASNTQQEKQDILVAVTLRDLQAVKLRKVIVSSVKSKRTPEKMHVPLVTVADLQNVHLKRSHCQLPPKLLKRLSFGRTPTKSPMNLRTQLKRVQINRSPGGTPLFDKENMETGTGLTPIITQALRRKFQVGHTGLTPIITQALRRKFQVGHSGLTPIITQALRRKFQVGHTGLTPIITQALRRKFQEGHSGLTPIITQALRRKFQVGHSGLTPIITQALRRKFQVGHSGLTPIITQALRRKFQSALPRGLSPKAKNLNESFD
ncbi:proline-rich protein 11 isoform X2 [Salmo trutta]|uniref:proline-rich protein 11 isoform X2 n=1 Tax=Salmo trutta TaxID=8032 RepID=UPI0011307514|nr:proline-rich protein 11-like isoform X2 [Salmo trutta]